MEFKGNHLALLGIKPQYMWEELTRKDLKATERIVEETIGNLMEIGRQSQEAKNKTFKILEEAGIIWEEFAQEVRDRRRNLKRKMENRYNESVGERNVEEDQERIKRLMAEITPEMREAMEAEEIIEEERRNEKTDCQYCTESRDELRYYKERNKRLEKENEDLKEKARVMKKENEKLKKELAKYTLFEEDIEDN